MSRYVMSYEPNQLKIREFLKKLQGKNVIDIVMKSLDYAEVKLEKAIIDINEYSVNWINRGGSICILFKDISCLDVNETEGFTYVTILLNKCTFVKFTLI